MFSLLLFLKNHGLYHILINNYATKFYKQNMIWFILVLQFKSKIDLIQSILFIIYLIYMNLYS